ncbi:MAG TPA: carbohydrate binding family 9 domain-containing protein, partial [Longimicrobiaceae bacterium]|nr:carbohydrate binding family 9 domain-containing protein [Longimicrobiaceae bacterium]
MRSSFVLPALLLLALPAGAQTGADSAAARPSGEPVRRVAGAVRYTGTAPALDGVLNDAAWSQAQPLTDFVQRAPNPGQPASFPTEARVLYDDAAIWVGVRLSDPHPDSIQAPVGRRDLSGVSSDWVHVLFDSYNDRRTAFRFSVNAAGVQKDAFHS